MKKVLINILLFGSIILLFSRCFEEQPQVVRVTPFEQIQEKLRELRDLQRDVSDVNVESEDLQAKIDNLVTEINELVAPGNIPLTLSIGVLSAAEEGEITVANATVSMNIRGQNVSATADSDGQVVFEDLRSGVVIVHIAAAGFTDVSFVVDLLVDQAGGSDDFTPTGEDYNVTTAIALYPTTVANGAFRFNGNLYYDPNRTDDILVTTDPDYGVINFFDNTTGGDVQPFRPAPRLNLVDGAIISETQPTLDARIQSWELLNSPVSIFSMVFPNPQQYGYVPPGTEGNIILTLYEEMFVTTTSAGDGSYELILPKGKDGNNITIYFAEFLGDENYIRAEDTDSGTGATTTSSKVREVIYTAMYAKYGATGEDFPGTNNNFTLSEVNNFSFNYGTSDNRTWDFYFGAKTLNE